MSQAWELLAKGKLAGEIERLNLASLGHVAEAVVRTRLAAAPGRGRVPDEAVLRLLHRTATALLLKAPGRYRKTQVHLQDVDGYAVYRGPPPARVRGHVRDFIRALRAMWDDEDALAIAAYTIWRLAWIHPFANGNGRTAFAFGYCCLCLKLGTVLPGENTVLAQLTADSRPTYPYLARAHRYHGKTKKRPNLAGFGRFLDRRLRRQMRGAR